MGIYNKLNNNNKHKIMFVFFTDNPLCSLQKQYIMYTISYKQKGGKQ